ncbi:centromere-associated protein K-domain-containing protein [Fennellomyces sp. T-0311]|nr:centromere-associated protein K-domain-containing protein [Fennellomyces sp. T-0311]
MWIEEKLKAIVKQAAIDFDETIAQDPRIESYEDGTARGNYLDQILADQKVEREQLWARLHELEDAHAAEGLTTLVHHGQETPEEKYLDTLKQEEQDLRRQLDQQLTMMNDVDRPSNETIVELQFKEKLSRTVQQLHEALKWIDLELTEAEETKEKEMNVLRDYEEVTEVLSKRLEQARDQGAREHALSERKEKLNVLRDRHRDVMDELVTFLETYYPSHPVDGSEGWRPGDAEPEMCQMSYILEDLMNLTVIKPHDPYLVLVKGQYWSPYIETIIKAGIAVRHPDDVHKIRLVDFRV